jgi:hypothetical protein
MNTFSIYYAVKRDGLGADVIEFGDASKKAEFKGKAKEDMFKADFANKYDKVVIASHYGVEMTYKVPFQELPKKKVVRKKTSEE